MLVTSPLSPLTVMTFGALPIARKFFRGILEKRYRQAQAGGNERTYGSFSADNQAIERTYRNIIRSIGY